MLENIQKLLENIQKRLENIQKLLENVERPLDVIAVSAHKQVVEQVKHRCSVTRIGVFLFLEAVVTPRNNA